MPTPTVLLKTWYCPICEYKQDTDPYDETIQHHPDYFPNVALGMCVQGWVAPVNGPEHHEQLMGLDLRTANINQVSGNDAADIALIKVIERDGQGNPVMVDSGQKEQAISIENGQAIVIEKPIMVEKTRELTAPEQQIKLDDANRKMDDFNAQAFDPRQVSYVVPPQPVVTPDQTPVQEAPVSATIDPAQQAAPTPPSPEEVLKQ